MELFCHGDPLKSFQEMMEKVPQRGLCVKCISKFRTPPKSGCFFVLASHKYALPCVHLGPAALRLLIHRLGSPAEFPPPTLKTVWTSSSVHFFSPLSNLAATQVKLSSGEIEMA